MNTGFSPCPECARLNLRGQRCGCEPQPDTSCDCTYVGNNQTIGPNCRQRINDAWAAAIDTANKGASAGYWSGRADTEETVLDAMTPPVGDSGDDFWRGAQWAYRQVRERLDDERFSPEKDGAS